MIEAEYYVNDDIFRQEKIESYKEELADECVGNRDEHIVLKALKRIDELEEKLDEAWDALEEILSGLNVASEDFGYDVDREIEIAQKALSDLDVEVEE
jgi:hypothetical protein